MTTLRARTTRLRGPLLMVVTAGGLWALMWTFAFYVYWWGPPLMLLSLGAGFYGSGFEASLGVLALVIKFVVAAIVVAVLLALYVALPAYAVARPRGRWWLRWGAAGLLLFHASYPPFHLLMGFGLFNAR